MRFMHVHCMHTPKHSPAKVAWQNQGLQILKPFVSKQLLWFAFTSVCFVVIDPSIHKLVGLTNQNSTVPKFHFRPHCWQDFSYMKRRASRFAKLIRRQQIASPGNKTLTILLRLERGGAFFCKASCKDHKTSSVSSSIRLARAGVKLAHCSYMIAVSAGLPATWGPGLLFIHHDIFARTLASTSKTSVSKKFFIFLRG